MKYPSRKLQLIYLHQHKLEKDFKDLEIQPIKVNHWLFLSKDFQLNYEIIT